MNQAVKYRTVIAYKNYFEAFFLKLAQKVRDKIVWTLVLIEEIEQVPETNLKHVEGTAGLYEIRVQIGKEAFRIFCFFDKGSLVVLTTGYQKKSQKAPKKEIAKALRVMEEYHEDNK